MFSALHMLEPDKPLTYKGDSGPKAPWRSGYAEDCKSSATRPNLLKSLIPVSLFAARSRSAESRAYGGGETKTLLCSKSTKGGLSRPPPPQQVPALIFPRPHVAIIPQLPEGL